MTGILTPIPLANVEITGGFWAAKQETNRARTIPAIYRQLAANGRISAMNLDWKEGQPNKPHVFFDSDVAKWIESAAYSLAHHRDAELETQVDAYVDALGRAQLPDGYVNSYFLTCEPQNRWKNERDRHELYCAGHLMEGAVAYFYATGKRQMLDILCRFADHIDSVYGPGEDQKHGYPGHQEIELALVKLYHAAGEKSYLDLAAYFINERGQQPHYYDIEARARGDDPKKFFFYNMGNYAYMQAHLPVRQQTEVVGHAVRAMYMYAGMLDVAIETGDDSLVQACKRLWDNLVEKRLYLTGGLGPTGANEGFTFDYDLPNESAYAETCAAIALVFWALRMLRVDPRREYADIMERALYNGVLSGVSLDGEGFFYANPLAHYPPTAIPNDPYQTGTRQPWFGCACCPPNLSRLMADLGEYIYAAADHSLFVHLYAQSRAKLALGGAQVQVEQATNYPWDGEVNFAFKMDRPATFDLALRLPGWCRSAKVKVNAEIVNVAAEKDGYTHINREWKDGDRVELSLAMPVERIYAAPVVRQDCGRVALQRGPLVYCLEEWENGGELNAVRLPREAPFEVAFEPGLLGGCVVIKTKGLRAQGQKETLYGFEAPAETPVDLTAIPYALWSNRGHSEMMVWVRE